MLEFLQENGTWIFFGAFALLMLWMHRMGCGPQGGVGSHRHTGTQNDVSLSARRTTDAPDHATHAASGSEPRLETDRRDAEREPAAAGRRHGGC